MSFPERVDGLVLIDTQAHEEDRDKLAQYEAFLQVALADGVSDDLASILLTLLFSGIYAAKPEAEIWRKKLMSADIDGRASRSSARSSTERTSTAASARSSCPAVVIHGLEDIAIEPERGEELARTLGAAYVPIEGAGPRVAGGRAQSRDGGHPRVPGLPEEVAVRKRLRAGRGPALSASPAV